MSEQVSLAASERQSEGKSANRNLRRSGYIPGVLYGGKEEPKKISIMGRLNDKVAIITGAGRGIGKEICLYLAKEGAKIVVNDLGGDRDGTGGGKIADEVVNEINDLGGEAVANYDSVGTVEGGNNIFSSAMDAFGQADILVNNAGILRDRTL